MYPVDDRKYPSSSSEGAPDDISWANADAWDAGDDEYNDDSNTSGPPDGVEAKSGDDDGGGKGDGGVIPGEAR